MGQEYSKLGWKEAIIITLGIHDNRLMHYEKEICKYIIDNNLYEHDGDTPQNTVNRTLTTNPNLFEGEYTTSDNRSGLYRLTNNGLARYNEIKNLINERGVKKETHYPNTPSNNKESKDTNIESYITLLKANHNIILHGAPGTGKTYLAKEIARVLCNIDKNDKVEDSPQFEMVQFHPSYDYTDFVEGLRPKSDGKGNIVFERKDGVFKAFCKRAAMKTELALKKTWDKLVQEINSSSNGLILEKKQKSHTYPIKYNKEENTIVVTYISGTKNRPEFIQFNQILQVFKDYNFNSQKIKDILCTDLSVSKGKYRFWSTDQVWPLIQKINEYYIQEIGRDDCQVYVFLIDEINRGDMSKIFGELFFSIDPGYRGEDGKINTQYQNMLEGSGDVFKNGFYIPKNVYIIGTMNDIDRSVESMDFAMRRRFQFIEITAESRAEGMGLKDTTAYDRMTNLNNCIISEDIGLSSSYQIGGSYFLKKVGSESKPITSDAEFKNLWDYRLEGLLREYLRGEDEKSIKDKLEKLRKAFELTRLYKLDKDGKWVITEKEPEKPVEITEENDNDGKEE